MFRRILAAIGIGSAALASSPGPMTDGPYKDDATNLIYQLLFCDRPQLFKDHHKGVLAPPWSILFSDSPDMSAIGGIADDQRQESRVRMLAFNTLRAAQKTVSPKEHLGTIIDSFTYDLTSEQRVEVINSRKKIYLGPRRRLSPEEIRKYSRSIPKSWREEILKKANQRCVHCGGALNEETVHIDHINPFSLGGLTVMDNLQALCAPCNLSKGNRSIG